MKMITDLRDWALAFFVGMFGVMLMLSTSQTARAAEANLQTTPATRPSARVETFLGPRTIAILDKANRVGVFRLKAEGKASEQMSGYPITDIGKEQGREFAAALVKILYDEKTYDFETAKGCEFEPGVGFRLMSDEGSVDLILCFHCNELELFTTDGKHKEVEKKHEDFDRARAALVKLAKTAFPDDREIQELKGKK